MILMTVHSASIGAYIPIQKGGIVVLEMAEEVRTISCRNAKTLVQKHSTGHLPNFFILRVLSTLQDA